MSKGILLFAHNNDEIDYAKIALCNALMIKKNMVNNHITLISDEGSVSWLKQNTQSKIFEYAFDNILFQDHIPHSNIKKFRDTRHTIKELPYHNYDRVDAYELSPYDETLMIDADYLVCNKSLDQVFGSKHDLMMNWKALSLKTKKELEGEIRLTDTGIKQAWATAVYFKKSEYSEIFFTLCKHIKENYDFYKFTYGFKGTTFRNDFVFSIAAHMMDGFDSPNGKAELPTPYILTSLDYDELMEIPKANTFKFLVEKDNAPKDFFLTTTKDVNIHIMNKYSLVRHADRLIELYGDV